MPKVIYEHDAKRLLIWARNAPGKGVGLLRGQCGACLQWGFQDRSYLERYLEYVCSSCGATTRIEGVIPDGADTLNVRGWLIHVHHN